MNYQFRHVGADAFFTDDPIPAINPAEFGSYESTLAARVDGNRAARGLSRAETTGCFAKRAVMKVEVSQHEGLLLAALREVQALGARRKASNGDGARPN